MEYFQGVMRLKSLGPSLREGNFYYLLMMDLKKGLDDLIG